MQHLLRITKALSDETRIRILMALSRGELCLCQLIDLLALAPSTVSKHMSVLQQCGLVERRKQGRWHFFRLAWDEAPDVVTLALGWLVTSLENDSAIRADADKLELIETKDLAELAACYRS